MSLSPSKSCNPFTLLIFHDNIFAAIFRGDFFMTVGNTCFSYANFLQRSIPSPRSSREFFAPIFSAQYVGDFYHFPLPARIMKYFTLIGLRNKFAAAFIPEFPRDKICDKKIARTLLKKRFAQSNKKIFRACCSSKMRERAKIFRPRRDFKNSRGLNKKIGHQRKNFSADARFFIAEFL